MTFWVALKLSSLSLSCMSSFTACLSICDTAVHRMCPDPLADPLFHLVLLLFLSLSLSIKIRDMKHNIMTLQPNKYEKEKKTKTGNQR